MFKSFVTLQFLKNNSLKFTRKVTAISEYRIYVKQQIEKKNTGSHQ